MLKKLGYIFTLFIIFALSLEAKSLLYKVNSKTSTVYILGSIHLAKPEVYPLAKEIEKAYNKSDVLVLELDPTSEATTKTIEATILKSGMYPKGKTLQTQLTHKTYTRLKSYTDKAGVELEKMQGMRPWVVMLQLSIVEMMRLGYSAELGIDQHFLTKSKEDNKPIIELETAEEQMALLSKENQKFQDKLLFYTLESMHELEPMLDEMFRAWKNGEGETFDKIMTQTIEEEPGLNQMYDDLITKRNHMMSKRIREFLKTNKKYFVVVGSGHVVGSEGIVALLKKEGYTVEQY